MSKLRSLLSFLGLLLIAGFVTGCIGGIAGIGVGSGGNTPGVTGSGQPVHPKIEIPRTDAGLPPHVKGEVLVRVHDGADVDAIANAIDAEVLPTGLEHINVVHMRLNGDNRSLTDALRALDKMEGVRYQEPNYTDYRLPYMVGTDPFGPFDRGVRLLSSGPNDPAYASHQYGPQRIQAPAAWEAGFTGEETIIAVIDTGVDSDHPDLVGRVLEGDNPYYSSLGTEDFDGHGTHVAAIAAAGMDDGVGIVGVAPDALIFPLRVFNPGSDGRNITTALQIAAAVLMAADPGSFAFPYPPATVINMSLGGPYYSQVMADAIHFALEQGVVVVAANGNDFVQAVGYPAAYPGVIAVGATDPQDKRAIFSTPAAHISVAAPGMGIYSAVPPEVVGSQYRVLSGTSMAAPHVSGAVALVREARPDLAPAEVKRLLERTADAPLGATPNSEVGHGRINVARALALDDFELDVGEIEVAVQTQSGQGILLADVVLYRGDEFVWSLLTSEDLFGLIGQEGVAVFRGLEPGDDYRLTVRLDKEVHGLHLLKSVEGIQVQAGKRTQVVVIL